MKRTTFSLLRSSFEKELLAFKKNTQLKIWHINCIVRGFFVWLVCFVCFWNVFESKICKHCTSYFSVRSVVDYLLLQLLLLPSQTIYITPPSSLLGLSCSTLLVSTFMTHVLSKDWMGSWENMWNKSLHRRKLRRA